MKEMSVAEALRIAGRLSFPNKMPGTSYALPAANCIVGAKLARIAGSVCHSCYALRDRYLWANAQKHQTRHLTALGHPFWIAAMVRLLLHYHRLPFVRIDLGVVNAKARGIERFRLNETGFHRWHDSGDLQSVEHLSMICEVARRTPRIRHWLPTQELGMVKRYVEGGGLIPANLVIRVSSVMIDDPRRRSWPHTSSAVSTPTDGAHACPAPSQQNFCGSCRACWSPDVAHVAYHLH